MQRRWRLSPRWLWLLLATVAAGGPRHHVKKQRRHKIDGGEGLWAKAAELLHLTTPQFVYDMYHPEDRVSLISTLWSDAWQGIGSRFVDSNLPLVGLLDGQLLDDDASETRFRPLQGQSRWEAVIVALFRARSNRRVPIESAALAVMWLYYRVPSPVWEGFSYFSRAVMCRTWAAELCDDAVDMDPGPAYAVAEGITAAVFDNLMMRVNYGAYAAGGETGHSIEMTNWATVFLPAVAMPRDFPGMDALLGAGGIFKASIDIEEFISSFSMLSPDIMANQRLRWARFLEAAAVGCIWDDERYDSPYPPTKFFYHPPIFDRLQSSYEDVNFEMHTMRANRFHKDSDALMLGGDGLSFMRMIHRLSQDPRRYLETKPVVIPRMGENPHGLFHFMHGDWRILAPMLMKFAEVVRNKQVIKARPDDRRPQLPPALLAGGDPGVS